MFIFFVPKTFLIHLPFLLPSIQVENMMSTYDPSAYIVVYAVDDELTLQQAERTLAYLKMSAVMEEKPVILVANKTDLVRSRVVRTMGEWMSDKSLALRGKGTYRSVVKLLQLSWDQSWALFEGIFEFFQQ